MPGRIVLCFDGTWNSTFKPQEREDDTTVLKPANPLKLARAVLPVAPDNGARQLLYYDSGVGALGLYPGLSNRALSFVDSKLGGAWGAGFEANIEQAVTFLCHNYAPGDEIFAFGFSRGAAQAVGMTHFISWLGGIPPKSDAYYIPVFFRHYLETGGRGRPSGIDVYKSEEVIERIQRAKIAFLGVWDVVMALGSRFYAREGTSVADRSIHVRTHPADCVIHARHALAIDEKRYDFRPEIWREKLPGQSLEQRWFVGEHGNVGGSFDKDGLANIALHWIVDEAKDLGLAVDEAFIGKYKAFPQDYLGKSNTFGFKVTEALRFKLGKGLRPMEGYPYEAALIIHPSVIMRLCSDPARFPRMSERYRPDELVNLIRAQKDNWPEFITSLGLNPEKYPYPDDI